MTFYCHGKILNKMKKATKRQNCRLTFLVEKYRSACWSNVTQSFSHGDPSRPTDADGLSQLHR